MANANNIIDVLLKTIGDVQNNNRQDPNQRTADPNVFDLLKDKLRNLDEKSRNNRMKKGKGPESILDLIKKEVDKVRKGNKKDPNVKTAPKSVFKDILKSVEQGPRQQAQEGIQNLIQEYRIDVSRVPRKTLQEIQNQYIKDKRNFDKQYAQAIYDTTRQYS